jgi:hypothetical protein
VNNTDDRILSLDPHGCISAKTRPIAKLNPGGGNFGPDGSLLYRIENGANDHGLPPGLLWRAPVEHCGALGQRCQ